MTGPNSYRGMFGLINPDVGVREVLGLSVDDDSDGLVFPRYRQFSAVRAVGCSHTYGS